MPTSTRPLTFGRLNERPVTAVKSSGSPALWISIWIIVPACLMIGAIWMMASTLNSEEFSASKEPVDIVVANTMLAVPQNMIRSQKQRSSHTSQKLDLFASWPNMEGYTEATKEYFKNPADLSDLIFLAIEPRAMIYDMSGRLRPIYSRFFEGVGIIVPSGLVQQPLTSSAGFIDEDLYFDPSSPYPFVARCTRNHKNGLSSVCIRDIHLGKDLMMTYRFDKKLLMNWADLDRQVRKLGNQLKQL